MGSITLKLKPRFNKTNRQINISLPRKKFSKELLKKIPKEILCKIKKW